MSVKVEFFGLLRRHAGTTAVVIAGSDLAVLDILRRAEETTGRRFLDELLDPEQRLLAGTIVLIDGENIRLKQGLETRVPDGSCVALFSPAGGG